MNCVADSTVSPVPRLVPSILCCTPSQLFSINLQYTTLKTLADCAQTRLGKDSMPLIVAYFHDAHYALPLLLVGVNSGWIVSTSMKYEDGTFRCILNKHSII